MYVIVLVLLILSVVLSELTQIVRNKTEELKRIYNLT